MTTKTLIILSAFLLTAVSPLLSQTKKEKWVTYQDKTYPFSFVYPETIVEKNAKGKYETVFQGWDGKPKAFEEPFEDSLTVKYAAVGGIDRNYFGSQLDDIWMNGYEGFAAVIFESSSALKSALDKEIKLAQKEEACRANGYTIRKSTVTMKGGIKATDYFFCHPRLKLTVDYEDKDETWLEMVIWRIPKGLSEHIVLILHYEIPVKKRTSFIWKTDEKDEGSKEFVEKTPQSHLKAIEGSRRDDLKTLNSFQWHKK